MAKNGPKVNSIYNVISLEAERKQRQYKRRDEKAVAEGRIVANWVSKDGTPRYRIRLSGTGAELFRKLMAAGARGIFPNEVTLDALDQLRWAGVYVFQWGGLRGRLALRYPAESYVLEEGKLACAC